MNQRILTPTFSFFLLLLSSSVIFLNFAFSMLHMSQMTKISQMSCVDAYGWVRVWVGGCWCARVCVWDGFSEYLLETRFLTSANYNPHPLRIFSFCFTLFFPLMNALIYIDIDQVIDKRKINSRLQEMIWIWSFISSKFGIWIILLGRITSLHFVI